MNKGNIIGRLTRDPELRETGTNHVCSFTVAVDRPRSKDATDFLSIKVWGKTAENCKKYLHKGSQVGITGSVSTGSYEKDGVKVYTTDVLAYNVQFLGGNNSTQTAGTDKKSQDNDFQSVDSDDDIPF